MTPADFLAMLDAATTAERIAIAAKLDELMAPRSIVEFLNIVEWPVRIGCLADLSDPTPPDVTAASTLFVVPE